MAKVEEFNSKMIEKYLKDHNLKYFIDSDGDFQVSFGYDDDWGAGLVVWLTASGSNKQIYNVVSIADKRIQKDDWGRAVMICNTWNKERRWPKAYLVIDDPAKDQTGTVFVERQVDLVTGVHYELFDHLTSTSIAGMFQFWEWANKEQNL